MGHGLDGHPGMKVPDASSYKMENAKPLLRLQADLAKEGLKDPWLRNHIWKYDPKYGTLLSRARYLFRGWKVGVAAFIVTIAVEKALGIEDYHGHAKHEDGEHH